ncbi:MAG TPA: hypothetical protein VH601_19295 [Bryobacteraceae bacterium]|jgi:hypothetical protein
MKQAARRKPVPVDKRKTKGSEEWEWEPNFTKPKSKWELEERLRYRPLCFSEQDVRDLEEVRQALRNWSDEIDHILNKARLECWPDTHPSVRREWEKRAAKAGLL